MNKRLCIGLVILAVAVLAVAAWFTLRSSEPEYQGKRLSWWVAQTDLWLGWRSPESDKRPANIAAQKERVAFALRQMGTNALPHLVQLLALEEKPTSLRSGIAWLNEKQNFVKIPLRDSPPWRMFAAEAFRLLGTNAEPAIPELAKLLKQERTSPIACECLFSIGPASLPALVGALTNSSEGVQNLALQLLGDFGPAARDAVPTIAEIARSTNLVSYMAIRVLSEVDTNSARYLPLFESRLFDTNYPMDAAFALGRMGPEGVPLLLRAITNQNKQVRTAAIGALQPGINEFGPGRPTTPPDYSFRKACCAFNLKAMSAAWLVYSHQEDRLIVPALTRTVSHSDSAVQAMAVEQLRQQGLFGAAGLAFATAGTNQLVRQNAGAALAALGVEVRGGAIIRGKTTERRLAITFTGHSFAEGGEAILNELAKRGAKGSFFLTGDFLTNGGFAPLIRRIVNEGHYLGPHSDKHLLYCSWDDGRTTLVERNTFVRDLANNLEKIETAGRTKPAFNSAESQELSQFVQSDAAPRTKRLFLPPYEHYNRDIVQWTFEMGLILINFTPGTRSNADYTGEADKNFVSSQAIFDSILKKEREDPHGLNGFILLLHLGSGPGRKDKFHHRFGELLDVLAARGYQFVRVDELLEPKPEENK